MLLTKLWTLPCTCTRVLQQTASYHYLGSLKPAQGSTQKKQRVGRGDSSGRGNSAGRGQKGQKARSGSGMRVGFEGGQTPLTRAFPKRGFTPRSSDPAKPLPLSRLVEWINQGRIDPTLPITLKELHQSNCVKGISKGGVKLLGDPVGHEAAASLPPVNIIINKASKTAIEAVEAAGGRVVCRYYNALGIRATARPEAFLRKGLTVPRLADPIQAKDIAYYSDESKRGYLALKARQASSSAAASAPASSA